MQTQLKGTGWILASLILTIVVTILGFILLLGSGYEGLVLFNIIDIILISFCYKGYKDAQKGWATFALIYGIIAIILVIINATIPIGGVILLIGGVMGSQDVV